MCGIKKGLGPCMLLSTFQIHVFIKLAVLQILLAASPACMSGQQKAVILFLSICIAMIVHDICNPHQAHTTVLNSLIPGAKSLTRPAYQMM